MGTPTTCYKGTYRNTRVARQQWTFTNFQDVFRGRILDVGCDEAFLRSLPLDGQYFGVDFRGQPDAVVNLEQDLPFQDTQFDLVLCTDVLEHIDRLHFLFDEVCRVSRRYVLVSLPNMYESYFRLRCLMGTHLNKYGLPAEPPADRHKWFFMYEDARKFVLHNADRNGFSVVRELAHYPAYRRLLPLVVTKLARWLSVAPNLFALTYWCLLERQSSLRPEGDRHDS